MKKIFAILMILSICAVGRTVTDANITTLPDSNASVDCQGRIKQLEQIIESLQKRLDKIINAYNEIKTENEQLKASLPKEKTTTNIKSTAIFDPNNGIVYCGKKRNKQWFNMMYKEFQNKIAFVDGKYTYIDKNKTIDGERKVKVREGMGDRFNERSEESNFLFQPVPEGTLIKLHNLGTVLQVLGQGEALISRSRDVYHIKGYKGSLVDKQSIFDYEGYFYLIKPVGAGTFEYSATSGAKKTIQSFVVCEPLTKEQFVDAINSGFILTKQSEVGDKTVEQPIP